MTTDGEELAGLRRDFAAGSHQIPEPSACPEPETIWEAVRGSLPPAGARDVVEHTARCPSCAEDWRLALALWQQETAAAAPAPLRVSPRVRRLRTWGLAAAAALALAVVGVQWLWQPTSPTSPVYRDGEQKAIQSQVADGRALPRDRFVLRWTAPVPAGATYGIEVSTEDLQEVASAEGLREPRYQVPAAALKDFPAGSRLLWKVEADLPKGGHVSSQTFVTEVQ